MGNNWAGVIKYWQENQESVGSFLSQIGKLYIMHNLWAYKDLQFWEENSAAWRIGVKMNMSTTQSSWYNTWSVGS